MALHTPLYDQHKTLNAQWTQFGDWEMPVNYGSQIDEHHAVRQHAGIFDVSHMGIVDLIGKDAKTFLRYALVNDVAKLKQDGDALYTCMLNGKGGVIDDLIIYYIDDAHYRIVWNAGTRDKDFAWFEKLIKEKNFEVKLTDRKDLAMIAVQGPEAMDVTKNIFPTSAEQIAQLKPFKFYHENDWLMARTGYTGENGVEITAPIKEIVDLWKKFIGAGVQPCGLGARDTLRLEAGLNLYGHDMTEETSPLISNLGWTIDWSDENRDFVGKEIIKKEKEMGIKQKLVGLILPKDKGVLRQHQKVIVEGMGEGEITSGGFSPTLNVSIALARVPKATTDITGKVERRGEMLEVKIVKPCFVRHGKSML